MGDWPGLSLFQRPVISALDFGIDAGAISSAVWPAANRAIYWPFRSLESILVTKLWVFNGAAVSGNIDIAIYGKMGMRLVSAGSTAQAGTSAVQSFDITDTYISAGLLYYFAVSLDNGTGALHRVAHSTVARAKTLGHAQEASAFPLPATATFATCAAAYLPACGLTTKTIV